MVNQPIETHGLGIFCVVIFNLGPLVQGHTRIAKLKSAYNSLIIGPRGLKLSDQEALALHQVKAHDVKAFTASKAFQSGASLEQILSACHWKSHNTITQFYLKDLAWADTELFHLGPVVAAQQVRHQAKK